MRQIKKRFHVLVNVQSARLLAALLVVVHHANHEAIDNGLASKDSLSFNGFIDGSLGVDIFFVISGLIMIITSRDKFGSRSNSFEFIKRRLARIVPLYWIFTILMLIAIAAVPRSLNHSAPSFWQFASSLLFIPVRDTAGLIQPVLGVGWTLNYEMLFYTVFTIAMLLPYTSGVSLIFGVLSTLAVTGIILPETSSAALVFWTSPIIMEFLFGMLLGIGLASSLGWIAPPLRWIAAGVPAAMIVAAAALGPQPAQSTPVSLLRLGGDASYALYLSHPFAINLTALLWRHLPFSSPIAFVVGATSISLIVGIAVHLLVERPLLDLLHRRPVALMHHPLARALRGKSRGRVLQE
jgi:exopolysaccharide production protein ExoZ